MSKPPVIHITNSTGPFQQFVENLMTMMVIWAAVASLRSPDQHRGA